MMIHRLAELDREHKALVEDPAVGELKATQEAFEVEIAEVKRTLDERVSLYFWRDFSSRGRFGFYYGVIYLIKYLSQ